MEVIHKFAVLTVGEQVIRLPVGARVLHVGEQFGALCLWAAVEHDAPLEDRRFVLVPTGAAFLEGVTVGDYIATAIIGNGVLVWHLFADNRSAAS